MLRRKFMITLAPLVVLLLTTAVVAISLLQGVLRDLHHIHSEAWTVVEHVNGFSIGINAVEVELYAMQLGRERHLDKLIDLVNGSQQLADMLGSSYIMQQEGARTLMQSIQSHLPEFRQKVAALATVQDPALKKQYTEDALSTAVLLRQETLPLSVYVRDHARQEQTSLSSWFRWLVLGLAIVFLLLINLSVIILLRLAALILRPVESLVAATRELGQEHFDYRVQLARDDEFDELGEAYNTLAERLQSNEQRKIEVLQQVAVAINHELNNAIAIIELQLQVISRQAQNCPGLEKCLREIHESLRRVTQTAHALKQVRRIVLTDYLPGTKMLDLERSTQEEQVEVHAG